MFCFYCIHRILNKKKIYPMAEVLEVGVDREDEFMYDDDNGM